MIRVYLPDDIVDIICSYMFAVCDDCGQLKLFTELKTNCMVIDFFFDDDESIVLVKREVKYIKKICCVCLNKKYAKSCILFEV